MSALPFAESHFVPGPAVEEISCHPNALDLRGRLPFAVGAAAAGGGGASRGGQGDDQRDGRSTAPSRGMIALQWDETGKSKPPRGPPGGPGDDGDPDGGGGGGPNDRNDPAWLSSHVNPMDTSWRSYANNTELNLLDIPS
eukprot:6320806-Pyramimonas_sp.AAC.1